MNKKYIVNKKSMLLLFLSFSYLITNAQIYQSWVSRYNGGANLSDSASTMALDNSGNIFVAGSTQKNLANKDFIVVKYNPNGDTLWTRTHDGPHHGKNIVSDMTTDGSGNVYITGEVDSNYVTIGYNPSGNLLWTATYSGPGSNVDHPKAIATDASNNVYVTGYSDNAPGLDTNYDYVTIKYNSAGVQQWLATYSGPGPIGHRDDRPYDIAVDATGNVYVTGYAFTALGHRVYMTVKYNTNGIQQWATPFDRNLGGYSAPEAIVVNSSFVWVTGRARNSVDYDYATVKYDLNGVQQWAAIYDGGSKDFARRLGIDNFGNAYVTGSRRVIGGTNDDCLTIKYDANGVQQWIAAYNGPDNLDDDARRIIVTGSGDVYIGGESNSIADSSDYVLIKYNTLGAQQWVERYNGTANSHDGIKAMGRNSLGDIFVTGYSDGVGSAKDIVTIKYSTTPTTTSIGDIANVDNLRVKLFPSPCESKATLYLPDNIINSKKKIMFKLYDILGNEIKTIENINSSNTEINKDNLSSGIYFYSLLLDNSVVYNGKIMFK